MWRNWCSTRLRDKRGAGYQLLIESLITLDQPLSPSKDLVFCALIRHIAAVAPPCCLLQIDFTTPGTGESGYPTCRPSTLGQTRRAMRPTSARIQRQPSRVVCLRAAGYTPRRHDSAYLPVVLHGIRSPSSGSANGRDATRGYREVSSP